ncbi:MAG: ATP synthase F1 subunit epsilon [Candidatus Puniceispirillaceae bacterium]
MAETTQFELVTPARVMVSQAVEMVTAPGSEGQFGVLARHAPVIANLQMGRVDVYENGQITSSYMIDGGLADVTGEKVVILAQRAEDLNKVTAAELQARAKEASEADAAFLNAVEQAISA